MSFKNCLEPFGYQPIPSAVGTWNHKSRLTKFYLCVDDFGIKFWSKEDTDHLCDAISANFRYAADREGKNYYELSIVWNYKLGHMDISMLKPTPDALKKLNYVGKKLPQYSPHRHVPFVYGKKGS